MPNQLVASGSFTSAGVAKSIALRSDFDRFEVYNYTQAATQQATGRGVQFVWQLGMAADTGLEYKKTNSTDALNLVALSSGGFTRQDQSVQSLGAAKTVIGITNANPAVVNVTAHGYSVGDRVIFSGVTLMQQISGIPFEITAVGDADHFTLGWLDASGFAAAATGGSVRKMPAVSPFFPQQLAITKISQAASAVVTFSTTHGMVVGSQFRIYINSSSGMSQANGLLATVSAVSVANNTVTVNIDSSAFTAFTWPTSANALLGWTPPQGVPVGEVTILTQAERNQEQLVMVLAAGAQSPAGSNGDVIYWAAFKSGYVNNEV